MLACILNTYDEEVLINDESRHTPGFGYSEGLLEISLAIEIGVNHEPDVMSICCQKP